jgi:hypothetical protein
MAGSKSNSHCLLRNAISSSYNLIQAERLLGKQQCTVFKVLLSVKRENARVEICHIIHKL